MTRHLSLIFVASLLAACSGSGSSGSSSASSGSSTGSNAGGSSGTSSASLSSSGSSSGSSSSSSGSSGSTGACAADAHAFDGGCDVAIAWEPGPDLAVPRDHHGTFLVDPGPTSARFLYAAGGFSQATATLLPGVVRAPVADDGTLGPWADAAPLPLGISGMGVVVTHNEVVLTGGYSSKKSWSAAIQPDGSLGTWTPGPDLDQGLFHGALVAFGDWVYVVGGINGNVTTDEVQRAQIGADGALGAWSVVAHLPYSLSHEVAAVDGATLYVVSGQSGNVNNNSGTPHLEVQVATFAQDGTLGPWTAGPPVPQAIETASAAVHDGFLYVLGGVVDATAHESSGVASTQLLRAPILSPGVLGAWSVDTASQLPGARSHVHQAPIFGSHIYSVSGLLSTGDDSPSVQVGTFH